MPYPDCPIQFRMNVTRSRRSSTLTALENTTTPCRVSAASAHAKGSPKGVESQLTKPITAISTTEDLQLLLKRASKKVRRVPESQQPYHIVFSTDESVRFSSRAPACLPWAMALQTLGQFFQAQHVLAHSHRAEEARRKLELACRCPRFWEWSKMVENRRTCQQTRKSSTRSATD
jgi:hypothetical protein